MPSSSSIATAGLSLFALAALFASTVPEPVSAHGLHEQRSSLGNTRRRHHARLAAATDAQSKRDNEKRGDVSTLVTGLGMGTLYFDVNGGGTCGPVNGWHSYAETNGYAMCEPNTGYKTLAQRGSNRVVAMPSNMLAGNQAKYCGKEVVVTYGDNTVENLVLWDGCASCNSNNGLDFSSTVFAEIFGESKCGAGRISGMSWKITSKQIWSYPDGNPVSGNDNNDDNEDDSGPAALNANRTSSSSSSPLAPSSSSSSSSSASSSQAWSESSSWVASSSSSSSSKDEAKPVGKPTNTKVAQVAAPTSTQVAETPAQTEDNDDEDAEDCDAEGDNDDDEEDCDGQNEGSSTSVEPVDTASLPPVLVVVPKPTATSSSATSSSSQPPAESSASPVPESTATQEAAAPADEPSAPAVVDQPAVSPSPASSGEDGGECNATPGAWKCVGRSLQQCVQNPGDWTWMTRVECKVDIINCDSPNPVCASY